MSEIALHEIPDQMRKLHADARSIAAALAKHREAAKDARSHGLISRLHTAIVDLHLAVESVSMPPTSSLRSVIA